MSMSDPIADMLTRIRNANMVSHQTVDVPASKLKVELARVLKEEGFIAGYEVKEAGKLRLEGKDYLMQDGDIVYFRFNV